MTRDEHLMTIAVEECAEVQQRLTKALRFGLEQVQAAAGHAVTGAADESMTNRERILLEYADLVATMGMLGLNDKPLDPARIAAKREKVERFLKYSAEVGTLQ